MENYFKSKKRIKLEILMIELIEKMKGQKAREDERVGMLAERIVIFLFYLFMAKKLRIIRRSFLTKRNNYKVYEASRLEVVDTNQ